MEAAQSFGSEKKTGNAMVVSKVIISIKVRLIESFVTFMPSLG
jgi:hypothetical protein